VKGQHEDECYVVFVVCYKEVTRVKLLFRSDIPKLIQRC